MWYLYIMGSAAVVGGLSLLIWKFELRLKWALPWVLVISPICMWLAYRFAFFVPWMTLVLQLFLAFLLSVVASIIAVATLFFRDPRRTPLADARSILSPADGKIIYIKSLEGDRFPIAVKKGKDIPLIEFLGETFPIEHGFQIGIMMSYLDVHVNRAPISGKVQRIKKIPGSFHSLKHLDSLLENERVFSIISGPTHKIGIVQIASRLVRRIVPFIKEGDDVRQGDRIGIIRFGSQVDLIIPSLGGLIIVAKVGDYVKAGLSVVARYEDQSGFMPKEQTRAIRTWESEEYHSFWRQAHFAYLDRMERKLLRTLIEPGNWFIDIGGGYGRLMDLYKDCYAKIVISDYSMSMLEDAHRLLSQKGIKNISLIAADVHRLPFIDGAFDSALMVRLIHHIKNPAPMIQEVRRILKPLASFIFEYQNKRNFNFLLKASLGLMKQKDLVTHDPLELDHLYWNFHPGAIERLLADGFVIESTLGGGLFWHRKILTFLIPKLESVDSAFARSLGRHALTHQLFLKLRAKKDVSELENSHRIRGNSLVDILKCLRCGQSVLEFREDRLVCAHCHQAYPIHENIYDFRLNGS